MSLSEAVRSAPAAWPGRALPADFLWGASSSAYQIEGASAEDGKGPSVQDVKTVPAGTPDFSVCSDHYHRWAEDIALLAELGLKSYRFSIAWTRILPEGTGAVNPAGVEFYSRLIDECLWHGIEPIVTMYHFDLPTALDARGGWADPATVDAFVEFARVLFAAYGDRVTHWLTINEQNIMTLVPHHGLGAAAGPDYPLYQANHHMLLAQARAMALCHEVLPAAKIGPAPNIALALPLEGTAEDVLCAQYLNAVRNWLYLDAAVLGRYNTLAVDHIRRAGYRLDVSDDDLRVLREGRPDFIAFNYYNTETVTYAPGETLEDADGAIHGPGRIVPNPHFATTDWNWPIDPLGFRTTLQEIHSRYGLPLMVTENGLGAYDRLEPDGTVDDGYRIDYLRDHITAMKQAIDTGVPVIGYHPWSAIDLISTHDGFLKRYGFVYVRRDNESTHDLARFRKKSFHWYRRVIASGGADLA
ncbi:glycoside hydrolase family 1 protein [Raineyella sp. LH-20]|uniref:glycoside hydrolase family 1 protein n=1 Tax=Raineyella sp. LH-20 TaxID=3081204 RepID=UPI0029543F3A|nr:glycoside hydrolase family 1 protein [Raineyella sp. LH-20]WOP19402.1 glycoside hydrolase family 1 protein [Raineyella sp. LH-20]